MGIGSLSENNTRPARSTHFHFKLDNLKSLPYTIGVKEKGEIK